MAHVHSHAEDRGSYYLDQLFMIGICGALAGVTIMLYQSNLLKNILHEKFHLWVLGGGLALLALVLVRAVAVWISVDETAAPDHGHGHGHGHDHHHDHDHDHGPGCGHDHDHPHDHDHGHGPAVPAGPSASTAVTVAPAPAAAPGHTHGHGHGHDAHEHGWAPWRYVILLLPVVLYFLILSNPAFDREMIFTPDSSLASIKNFIIRFRSIVWEALPFIVLGAVIAGLLEELLPQEFIAKVLPRNRYLALAPAGLLGLVFPMCECGIIPVMRRLLRKGLPLSCCVAYLLAGPIVNLVVLGSTFVAFSGMENAFEGGKPSYQMGGWWMMGFRAGLGYLVAVVTAGVVEWLARRYKGREDLLLTPLALPGRLPLLEDDGATPRRRTLWERVSNISETALHDFVDITVFLILGALLAAGVGLLPWLTPDRIAELSREHALLAIVLMMVLAVVLCLCSEADAFVAASFVTLRPSAKVAFLVLGPMLDFKLYLMYTRVFRPRLIWTIYACVVGQVLVYSYATHLFWEKYGPRLVTPKAPGASAATQGLAVKVSRNWGLMSAAAAGGDYPAALASATAAWLAESSSDEVADVNFLQLEMAALSADQRAYYAGKLVRLTGRYATIPGREEREFTLVRYRINCCAADATPLRARIVLDHPKETLSVKGLRDKWVQVTGRVDFEEHKPTGSFHTVIKLKPTERTPLSQMVHPIEAPGNPYLQ
jgi:uncharacterized membrane protein YraQ (UPF0718 family)